MNLNKNLYGQNKQGTSYKLAPAGVIMKQIISFSIIVFYGLCTFGQNITTIDFYIENKQQKLNNNFNVYFIYLDSTQKIIYKPTVYKNTITHLPLLQQDDANYYILIEFENKVYFVTYAYYNFRKVDDWIIYFEKKPYKQRYFWEQWEDDESIKGGISILLGRGDAACRFEPITNFDEYFKKGLDLLKLE